MSQPVDPGKEPPPVRGPLQGLADVSDLIAQHPVRTSTFLRGLTIGALVGAAIAGSAIWRRWLRGGTRRQGSHGGVGGARRRRCERPP